MLGRVGLWLLAVALATMVVSVGVGVADSGGTPRAVEVVYVATGANFPDALGAGPAAGLDGGPILLVQQNAVPAETLAELNRLQPRLIVIVGGTAVVSAGVETALEGLSFGPTVVRLAGGNRYATAAEVSQAAFPCSDGEVFAGYGRSGPQCRPPLSGLWSLQNVDATTGFVGWYASMVLDGLGHPVIAYWDFNIFDLKLVHCNDAACAGGDDSIETVDATGSVGEYASLVLDANGYPVIAYRDGTPNFDLKLVHCNDAACDGGDESIETVDASGDVGSYASLVLDALGRPVIAYYDASNDALRLVHCDDPNCDGGDELTQLVDNTGDVGRYASLVLDASGNPVVAYYEYEPNYDLKLVHCNDPSCDGADESIETVDAAGIVGEYASLALDAVGNPVIAYHDGSPNNDLKLTHCNDPNCDGSNESIETVDSTGGLHASLVLDAAGNPVIAYYDATLNEDLKLVHCNDPNCDGNNETIRAVDTTGIAGRFASVGLDAVGNPVIAYLDVSNGFLKLAST